jgi:putative DNA methylase
MAVKEAQKHILEAHAERLAKETGKKVTTEDIAQDRAPRPRVLDMFAGGGSIPIEAARLGCESYAVDLNPVAYLIELCTTTYPQTFGPALAEDVEQWGHGLFKKTAAAVADLFAPIPTKTKRGLTREMFHRQPSPKGDDSLAVIAYYWTRTATCPNPKCRGTVPLYRQTWLRQKAPKYVALRAEPDLRTKRVRFRVVEATSEAGLDFDPGQGSEGSSTECPFCHSALDGRYVRAFGDTEGFGQQLLCVIARNPNGSGKLYLADESLTAGEIERQAIAEVRARELEAALGDSSLDELIPPTGNAGLATGNSYLYGIRSFRQAFLPRQACILLTMAHQIRRAHSDMLSSGLAPERSRAIATYLALCVSRIADKFNSLSRWNNVAENVAGISSMKRFAMMWDFPEVNIFGGATGDATVNLDYMTAVIRQEGVFRNPTKCLRASATELPFEKEFFDAVITDPPYYDNESYSELSDVSYIWLRPTIGFLYPEHFASKATPKKLECVAAAYRQGGKAAAKAFYEESLFKSLREAHRVLKPGGILVMVYAHKTTLGWSTLVDAIRRSGHEVTEAWPLDTEAKARIAHQGDAALASSIFLVARRRESNLTGQYEDQVRPDLEGIVTERVGTLWEAGLSGADLVIACIGAGLRAFTRYAKVEYANGDEVPAERFLAEVESAVLDTILARLSKAVGANGGRYSLAGVDPATRFYVLWRYTYRAAELDAGEAIVFANGTHVELDGLHGLSSGARALIEKKKAKYRLLDYAERGDDAKLGMPSADGQPAPIIDALQRTLWLMEDRPALVREFFAEARPNLEQMRLVAQALLGPALKGGELGEVSPTGELGALAKLTSNWRSVVEDAIEGPLFRPARRSGNE